MKFISELPNIVKCLYNEKHHFTIHEWKSFYCKPAESILMKNTLEDFLNFVKDNKVTKHIVDVKKCTDTFTDEDLNYITSYLVPKEIEYGILYLANIVSEDIVTQVTTEFWQEEVKDGLVVRNFETIDEALNWLNEK